MSLEFPDMSVLMPKRHGFFRLCWRSDCERHEKARPIQPLSSRKGVSASFQHHIVSFCRWGINARREESRFGEVALRYMRPEESVQISNLTCGCDCRVHFLDDPTSCGLEVIGDKAAVSRPTPEEELRHVVMAAWIGHSRGSSGRLARNGVRIAVSL